MIKILPTNLPLYLKLSENMKFTQSNSLKKSSSIFALVIVMCTSILFSNAQPTINSFTPISGPIGSSVTINGTNFSSTPANNIVYFGGVKATVTAASAVSLIVTVPKGASYQPISVTTNQLTVYSAKSFNVTYSGGGNLNGFSFYERNDSTTDLHPNGMVVADFDGDGKSDIATANNYSIIDSPASISLLLNTGANGFVSFAPKFDIKTGVQTYAVATGDLDGDGKLDLASVSNADKQLSVFKNTSSIGLISFANPNKYPTGTNPFGIAINDLDGDGKLDILVCNWLSNTISVYKNESSLGNLSFVQKPDIITALLPNSLVLTDLNADGKADLTVVNSGSKSFSVFVNTGTPGTISFAVKTDFSTGNDYPFGVAAGDIDLDGKTDLVITYNNVTITTAATVAMSIFRNTSSGNTISFAAKYNSTNNGDAYYPSIGDINGDGLPDIIVPGFNHNISAYQNGSISGTIGLSIRSDFAGLAPYSTFIGDVDNDDMPDLIASNFTFSSVSIFKNTIKTPRVISITPNNGVNGTSIAIFGTNFNGATAVSFGETAASSFTVNSNSSITAIVGNGASGDVAVTNNYGRGKIAGFIYKGPPTISSFTPTTADSGVIVTIKGTNFTDISAVQFGGIPAKSYTVVSPTTIEAKVNTGSSGNITVTNLYGTATLGSFIYAAPIISSFTPTNGGLGDTIVINGTNFNAVKAVYFGNAAVQSFSIISPTQIKAVLSGGASGSVTVQTVRKVSLSGFTYNYAAKPVISQVSPLKGVVGSTVTITGNNFNPTLANNIVYFGAVKATIQSVTANNIVVTVPAGATYEPITVVNTGTALSGTSFNSFTVTLPVSSAVNADLLTQQMHFYGYILEPEIADLDGDGKTDIIYQNENSQFYNDIFIRKNASTPGKLSFPDSLIIRISAVTGAANRVGNIVITDMDGDGRKDIVALNFNYASIDSIVILRNTSTPGNISFADKFSFPTRVGTNVLNVFVADIDGDGRPDILTDGGFICLYRNASRKGTFSFIPLQDLPANGDLIAIADVNNDGKPDPITANGFTLWAAVNNSTPGIVSLATPIAIYSNNYDHFFTSISKGDIDGDQQSDLFIVNSANAIGNFAVGRNTGSGNSTSFSNTDYTVTGLPYQGALGDADGDGKVDLFTTSKDAPYQLTLYKNNSTAGVLSFAPRLDFSIPTLYFKLVTGDFDGDGKLDVMMGGTGIEIYKVKSVETPTVSASSSTTFCDGDSVILNSSAVSGHQWYRNAVLIPGATNTTYTAKQSGDYTVISTIGGISSLPSAAITVTVKPIPSKPIITIDGSNNLISSYTTGNQWYSGNAILIPGATAQYYKPISNGLYSVTTTQNGCTSVPSDAYTYLVTGVQNLNTIQNFKLMPNPASEFIVVGYTLNNLNDVSIQVFDMKGRIVLLKEHLKNGASINLSSLQKGIYIFQIVDRYSNKNNKFKVIKL